MAAYLNKIKNLFTNQKNAREPLVTILNTFYVVSGSFILKADIEGQLSCSVSARDGLSVKDVLWVS